MNPEYLCGSLWARVNAWCFSTPIDLPTLFERASHQPVALVTSIFGSLLLLALLGWLFVTFSLARAVIVFAPSMLFAFAFHEVGRGNAALFAVAVLVVLFLLNWRLTAVFGNLLFPLVAVGNRIPGAGVLLSWSVLMLWVVKIQWVADEADKHERLRQQQEEDEAAGRPVQKDDRPPSDLRKSFGMLIWLMATVYAYVTWIDAKYSVGNVWPLVRLYLAALSVCSGIAFALFALDKWKAKRNKFRVPEAALHFFELLGGWPGGMVARETFRHKFKKPPFLIGSRFAIFLNIALMLSALLLASANVPAVELGQRLLNVSSGCQ